MGEYYYDTGSEEKLQLHENYHIFKRMQQSEFWWVR